jgi:hypothetical protein
MALKKHSGIFFTRIAIALVFLCSAASATGLKVSFKNASFPNSYTLQNPLEAAEESSLLTSSFEKSDGDFSLRHSSPSRLFKKETNRVVFNYQQGQPKFSFVSYNLLLRPPYYHLLFRHKLF